MVSHERSLAVVFFGTPAFAAPTFEALLQSRHRVVGVVTQPDRPSGRGQKITAGPVKALALAAGLPVMQPERLKDPAFLAAFAALGADLGVVAAYGRIIPELVINTPRFGLINVHASLLPKYRGAAPVQRAVMAGDTETGVTIMRIVKELDAGGMFARTARPIAPDATSADVEQDLALAGAHLLVDVVDAIAAGTAREEPQDHAEATYARRIAREESPIDWALSARAIHNQVRGLIPWPHASTRLDATRLLVIRTALEPPSPDTETGTELRALRSTWATASDNVQASPSAVERTPGTVLAAHGDILRIATGNGVLRILALQPEGRRVMTAREFLAGRSLAPGTRLA
jgi:methionyl-tRNA formyltransferase